MLAVDYIINLGCATPSTRWDCRRVPGKPVCQEQLRSPTTTGDSVTQWYQYLIQSGTAWYCAYENQLFIYIDQKKLILVSAV